jgi:hypothetical protein
MSPYLIYYYSYPISGTPLEAVTAAPEMYNASNPFSAHYLPTIPL